MMVLVSDQSGCVEFAVYKGLSIIRKPETLAYLRWEEIIKLIYEQNGFERHSFKDAAAFLELRSLSLFYSC